MCCARPVITGCEIEVILKIDAAATHRAEVIIEVYIWVAHERVLAAAAEVVEEIVRHRE